LDELLSHEAMSWAHLSLESLMPYGTGVLPSRRLDNNETLEWLEKHRGEEYTTCLNMFKLHENTDEEIEKMCSFWKSAAHYDSVQRTLPTSLERLKHGSASLFPKARSCQDCCLFPCFAE
jgi:hypothetical protein